MSELQNDEYVEEVTETLVEEVEEIQSSDLATDSEGEHEQTPDDGEAKAKQDATQEAINRHHRKFQDERRRANELEQRLAKLTPEPQAPVKLERPDRYDDDDADYEAKQTAYEESIRQSAVFDANQLHQQGEAQRQQAEKQRQYGADLNAKASTYNVRAKEFGISEQDLQQAGQMLGSYSLSDDVAMFILDDEQGPLITKHLAANHADADAITKMSPMQAAMYIERTIKPKVAALKPKVTNAPKPATRVKGGAKQPDGYKYLDGAEFT